MSESNPNPFDFAAYLQDSTGEDWNIEHLTGGQANHVARATRPAEVPVDANVVKRFTKPKLQLEERSIVLKQAPPYFALLPDFPYSQKRQVIEGQALKILSDKQWGTSVLVPRLLHHDENKHVLIQSDLGSHPSLDQWLTLESTTEDEAESAGSELGAYLAKMQHIKDEVEILPDFTNEDAETVMQTVISNATGYMKDAGVEDWEALGNMAMDHWKSRERTSFSQGDIWFGTVLVESRPNIGDRKPILKICDWEMAGPNDPAADIAQIQAYMNLAVMSERFSSSPRSKAKCLLFAQKLREGFQDHFKLLIPSTSWYSFQRSWHIMHGWEMVNAAAWRNYLWCDCPGEGVKCDHIRTMIREGARILRGNDNSVLFRPML